MPPPSPQAVSVVTVLAITIGLGFCLSSIVIWGVSYITGWRTLAVRFPARPPLPGATSSFGSVCLNVMGNYSNCVRYHMDEECLHIGLIAPFAWSHPGISIPWPAIDIIDPKPRWGLSRVSVAGLPVRVPPAILRKEIELRKQLETLEPGAPRGASQIAERSS